MKINWKVRFKNPTFWCQILLSIFVPVLAYFGLNWEDMTTWKAIINMFLQAFQNPVVVVSIVVSILNCINDPTTKGLGDSEKALTYSAPK